MPCNSNCPKELTSQDDFSLGVIAGEEVIVRGAYDPNHGNANTGNVKSGFLPLRHLHHGELSVWRTGQDQFPNKTNIQTKIPTKNGRGQLFAIFAASAEEIRSIHHYDANTRLICIRDECESDAEGNKDIAHAHISLCDHLKSEDDDKIESNGFLHDAHTKLRFLFLQKTFWVNNADTLETLRIKHGTIEI